MVQSSGRRIFSAVFMKWPPLEKETGQRMAVFIKTKLKCAHMNANPKDIGYLLYLAHGLIFRARPRLMQKPAPPVANQKLTGR